jgi:hypothetical protein
MTTDAVHDLSSQRHGAQQLDRRLTILETRFDTTIAMLPQKSDLAELKAELKADIHGESAQLSKWIAATTVTMAIGFAGMIVAMLSRLHVA